MARLRGPLGGLLVAAAACVAVAAAYLPPRGMSRERREALSGLVTGPPSRERERANALAKEWRQASLELRLHEWRRRLTPELDRLRAANQPTLVLAIDTAWPRLVRERAAGEIERAWHALELGTTKIGVAVVIEPERVAAAAARGGTAYLLPDSAARHTCVVWSAPRPSMRVSFERQDARSAGWHAEWARSVLGACAFYARFGRPSAEIERWLASRQHRVAKFPVWDTTWTRVRVTESWAWFGAATSRRERAERDAWVLRTYPALVAGCMAGRTTACRTGTLGMPIKSHAPPRLIMPTAGSEAELPNSTLLLSDMIREFGGARFGRFWTATVPPDSAFHLAMDTTLGDWVLARQHAYGTTLSAGPTPSWGAGLLGLGVAALGLLAAVLTARRRQVT